MPSINKLYFVPYNNAEIAQSLSTVKKLVADKFVYTADDDLMNCCAVLNSSSPIIGDTAEVYLKTANLVTTVASATKVSTIETNRIFFSVDISDLAAGSYTLQAFISESGSPGVSSGGSLMSFNFTKTSTTDIVTFPPSGLQIYPQEQDYIANVTYPMHAAIPVPKGTIDYAEIADLGLYEDDVQIAAQIEVIDNWEGTPVDVDQPYRPRWIHIWFNAVWTGGTPKTYVLKKSAGTPPASGMSVTATNEFSFACTVDLATSTYSMATNYYLPMGKNTSIFFVSVTSNIWTASSVGHNCKTGTPVIFSTYSGVGNMVKGQIYYLRAITFRTFTLHPTYDDAINNTNIFNTGAVTNGFPSLQPIKPVPIKVTYGTSTALIPDTYPQIDPNKVYWANFVPAVSGAASFTVHETYDDAVTHKNKITFLSSTAGHNWTLVSTRTILAESAGSSWNCIRGHLDVVNHNLTTGMQVRGSAYYPVSDAIDEIEIYYVRSVTASNFTLHPTLVDANAGTNGITVSTALNPHYFMVVSTVTVDNGYVKAVFSRPFDGFHELYYDPSGTGTYTTPYITSEDKGWQTGLYMKDGNLEKDWNAFADPLGYVDVEYQNSLDATQNCNVVIRAEGKVQTMYQQVSPAIHYSLRMSIPAKIPMIKYHLATTIIETTSKAIKSLVFNIPIQNAYLLSGGIDDATVSETTYTITGVSSPNINLNSAHGWSSNQAVTFFTTGTLPSPLVQGTTYYVRNPGSDTIQVSLTSGGSAIPLTTSGSGTNKVYVDSPAYFYQKKHDEVTTTGPISSSGEKCDGWFVASGLANDFRTALLVKNTWQKFPKEVSLYRTNIGLHIWPYHGTRNFTTDEEAAASGVYKYNCFHQHLCLNMNVPNDYYQAWADQTDTDEELRPEWVMGANAQGVSMSNDFALIFSDSDAAFDAENWAKLYQLDPIALCDDDWNVDSKVFLTQAEKGADFATQEAVLEDSIIGWTNPEKVEDYGQFNYGDFHSNYVISGDRANLGDCWQNMRYYFTSQIWSLILRGSSNLMDIARRASDHYASVDMTRFDGNFGYFGGNLQQSNIVNGLISGPEHKNHIIGNFWKGGPIHWANNDYGTDDSIPLRGIYGSIPDPIGLLRSWLIDGNRWAKAGFEQWYYAIRNVENPPIISVLANKETIGTLVNALWAREFTHDPVLSSQIDAAKTALAVTSSTKSALFSGNVVSITAHGYQTGQRIRFTTTGTLPTSFPQLVVGKTYYACVISSSQFTVHQTLNEAHEYLHNVSNTAITFADSGSGSHSVVSGNIDAIDDPTWHPLWLNLYYELTNDPSYTQWIIDNADVLGYGISALAYSLTSDPIYLTRHFSELLEFPNLLHDEDGNKWDKFGVGPGEEKHFWHTFPHFKKQLQLANISSLTSPSITIQPNANDGDDIYIVDSDPTGNYDTANNLSLGDAFLVVDINARVLIRFKIDLPSDAVITSATLTLTNITGGAGISNNTINIYRLLRSWSETDVTWNKYDASSNWTTSGAGGAGTDYTTSDSVSVVLANSNSNLVASVTALAQDAIDSRSNFLSLLLIGPENQGTARHVNFASSDHATAAWRPKLELTWTTPVETGNYPIALGTPGDAGTADNTILVNNLLNDWDMTIDVADVTGSESMDVVISTISGTVLNTNYTFPTSTSFTFDRNGTLVHRQHVNLSGTPSAGNVQTVSIRTNTPEVYMQLGPHPEALLMTDFTEATAPVYRAKSFKGYFVPKVENADIDLTFTTTGDGGFTRLLIKDDNDDVISNTSLMFGRNPETIIIQPNGSGNNNDTYISQNASGTNYGNATTFSVGHTQEENGKEINDYDIRAILKFDLTSVINEYIAGATLTLTGISDQNDQTLTLYRCGQDNWTELGATWSTYNGTNIWSAGDPTTPSTSINYTGGDATFDITELVIDAIENRAGILNMVLDGGTDLGYVLATFASFENVTAASRPKITIHTATALTITINDSNMSNPTPWYVEATSSRNAYVDVKVEGPGDATPILFGADKTATYNLKYWAIGTPVAQFTADDTTGEAPFTIQFTDQSTNTPNTWSWNFGDGNTSTEQNPTHTYTTSGTYTVTLTASSPAGSDAEVKNNYITITDILDDAPLWGLDYDPMAELMNRGEGNKSAAAAGLPGVLARNPMLVKAPDGSILFLCHSASGFTNGGHGLTFAIRSKRSTDNGLTWSDPVDIYNYANFSPDNSWFQLSGVVVDEVGIDDDTPAIIVFGTKGDTTDQHHKNYIFRSEDNGQTWSAATEITSQIVNPSAVTRNVAGVDTGANTVTTSVIHSYSVGQAITFATSGTLPSPLVAGRTYFARVSNSVIFFVHETYDDAQAATNTIDLTTSGTGFHTVTTQWSWNIPTGIGIQLSDNSSNPGRLIVPCNHRSRGFNSNDTYYGPVTGHFIYSDDGGLNWDVLGVLPTEYTEEMTVIETSTADKLYANIKAGTGSYRNYATSINGGVNWSLANTDIDLEQLPAPGQLVRLNNDTIVLATTRDTSGLVHKAISLYTSADDGDTWVFVKTLFYRYAENCSILPLNDNHILLAFENSSSDLTNATPASNFEDTAYQSISLVKINKVWLDDTIPNVAEWFFNEETTGVRVNPYSPAIIDYGGRLNAKAVSYSATNTGLYTSNGIELTDANNDAIILSPDLGELFTNDPFTIEVEATIGVGENGMLISNRTSMGISLEVITNVLVATLSDGTFTTTSTGVTAVNDGVRRCYAVVRDKDVTNRLYIYIDGVLESGHAADTCGNVNMNNSLYLGQNYLFGSQLVATFHSCRITNDAVAALDLQVAPRTKITPHEFRNYTAPTPPAFVPTDLTDLETWLFASVDGGEAAFADSQWSLSYKLPYYSGAKISSYRDKSPNKYFFNILETAWIEYVTDSTIGPHYRPYFESTTPSNANLILKRDAASVYDFIPGGTFAIGMAVKINSMVGGGSQIVLDTQDASSANAGFHIYIDSNRKPGINVGGGAGAFNYAFTAATAMTVGDWYFLLYVGRGVGTGLDLYIGHYTNGVYDPDSPTIPTLTKYTSTNMTAPALTTNANPLTIGAKASDGTAPSDIYLKNIVIYSEVTQFATGNTINQDQLCAFNLYA